jgi:hypothetical protein
MRNVRRLLFAATLIASTLAGITVAFAPPAQACAGSCGDADYRFQLSDGTIHYGQAVSAYGQLFDRTFTCVQIPHDCNRPTGSVTVTSLADNSVWGVATVTPVPDPTDAEFSTSLNTGHVTGTYTLRGTYSGNFDTKSIDRELIITQAATTTSLIQDSTSTVAGQNVKLTATVHDTGGIDLADGASRPTGMIEFKDNGVSLASANINDPSTGVAVLNWTLLAGGTHNLTANYLTDGNYAGSAASPAVVHTVTKANVTNTLASSGTTVFGEPFTLTSTLVAVAPGAGTPTGTVTFNDTTLGTASAPIAVNGSGVASFTTGTTPVGSHSFTATYGGDGSYNAKTSAAVTRTVNKANTTTALTSPTPNPSGLGAPVTLHAAVTVSSPGAGTPTGTVQFNDGATPLGGPVPLGATGADFTTSALGGGTHSITATYSGDGNFNPSTSSPLSRTVTCTTTFSGSIPGTYNVPAAGTTCISGAYIGGGVNIPGGAKVSITNSTVGGNVVTSGAPSTIIVCGTSMAGLTISNAAGAVTIGDPYTAGCAVNSITGNATLNANHGGVKVNGNYVGGTLQATGNSGGATVIGGNYAATLTCSGNVPAAVNGGHPNGAGQRSGECADPGF